MTDLFRRRSLLGIAGIGTAAAAMRSDARNMAQPAAIATGPHDASAPVVSDRRTLAAAAVVPGARRYLQEGKRSGSWIWAAGDFAERVASDPLQGLYIAHTTVAAREGAWTREWDSVAGWPEWFGARADDAGFDNGAAIQAALDLCPTVLLGAGRYHIRSGLRITQNGARLIGAGITQTDQGDNDRSTEIICSSATETIIQIGSDSKSQPHQLTECIQMRDFTVRRAAAPFVAPSGLEGAIGISLRWCVNCHIERVFSIDNAKGWSFYGVVENYVSGCSALRAIAGTTPANDFFIGYHLDYNAPLASNAGNASLYFDRCRAFGTFGKGTPSLTYSAGLRTDGGWVDLYINALETGTLQYGIHGNGDGVAGGNAIKTENLTITNCVLDAAQLAAIRMEKGSNGTAIQISNNYASVLSGGTGISLHELGGSVSLTGNQCIIVSTGGIGLGAVNVTNLRATGNIFTRLRQAISLEHVTGFHIQDTIQLFDVPNQYPAVALTACRRGRIDCIIGGEPGSAGAGVAMRGCDHIEVNCTAIDPAVPEHGRKLTAESRTISATGPFGSTCAATGIL